MRLASFIYYPLLHRLREEFFAREFLSLRRLYLLMSSLIMLYNKHLTMALLDVTTSRNIIPLYGKQIRRRQTYAVFYIQFS